MRSSASTPLPRPDPAAGGSRGEVLLPHLWVVLACEDNPRLCTGRRVVRLGLAREGSPAQRPRRGAVLLSPHARTPVGPWDAAATFAAGIVAVDCSWNRLGDRGDFPPGVRPLLQGLRPRRLPFLLAANPQHYGRLGELNTAEALGAAIYLTRGAPAAGAYFARVEGRGSLVELNRPLLEEYRGASSPAEVPEIERRYFS